VLDLWTNESPCEQRDFVLHCADRGLLCDLTHAALHVGGKVITLKDGRRLGPDGWR
jgi:hypothetical protein